MGTHRAAGPAGGEARAAARAARPARRCRDEDMVNVQRVNLLDAAAPNPSVETLLHAFLPHKFIDHTHADAVLSLVDQPNGEELVAEVYGGTHGDRALRHPRLRPRQAGGRGLRGQARRRGPDPAQARHLHLRRRRARGLRAHDRARVAGPRRASPGAAATCSRRPRCRQASAVAGRGGADPARRAARCSRPTPAASRSASSSTSAPSAEILQLRRRRRPRRATPSAAWSRPTTSSAPRTCR